MRSVAEVLQVIRRKPNTSNTNSVAASAATLPIRLSGTVPSTQSSYEVHPSDGELGDPNGRTGNDWLYPDNPRGRFDTDTVNGDRLQDQTSRHLHEGAAPGRIPRGWNNRSTGKTGGGITGNPSGEIGAQITITGQQGGTGEMMYVPHTPTPRGVGISRPYLRTVDDAANVPAVFVASPRS
jgi:hypothetical protein